MYTSGKGEDKNLQHKSLLTLTISLPSSTELYSQMMFWEQSHGGNANAKFYVNLNQVQYLDFDLFNAVNDVCHLYVHESALSGQYQS
jgi:hypothetical protein